MLHPSFVVPMTQAIMELFMWRSPIDCPVLPFKVKENWDAEKDKYDIFSFTIHKIKEFIGLKSNYDIEGYIEDTQKPEEEISPQGKSICRQNRPYTTDS